MCSPWTGNEGTGTNNDAVSSSSSSASSTVASHAVYEASREQLQRALATRAKDPFGAVALSALFITMYTLVGAGTRTLRPILQLHRRTCAVYTARVALVISCVSHANRCSCSCTSSWVFSVCVCAASSRTSSMLRERALNCASELCVCGVAAPTRGRYTQWE